MTIYSGSKFHNGLKIILDGEPYLIESHQFIKPGKGQSFVRVKLRRLLSGTRIEKTFKSNDHFESANVIDINLTYLYNDNQIWYFINKNTFEQVAVNEKIIGSNKKWLFYPEDCTVTFWNDLPIFVMLPNFVELSVVNTEPEIKGDTFNIGDKFAVLSTGVAVKVPLFIRVGDRIKIDTRSGEYVSRIK